MKCNNLIEITKDLLYETWIDQPVFFTNILYNTLVKDHEKEVERFRLIQVLEKISSALADTTHKKEIIINIKPGKFRYYLVILNRMDKGRKPFLTVGFPEDFEMESGPDFADSRQNHDAAIQKKSWIIKDHFSAYHFHLNLNNRGKNSIKAGIALLQKAIRVSLKPVDVAEKILDGWNL